MSNTDNTPVTFSDEDKRYFGASIRHIEDDEEYYLASEVSTFLGYTKWTAFLTVLHRAKRVCEQGGDASLHFKPIEKLTPTGRGLARNIDDYQLTRHAFLLIVMNADTYLSVVAQGKSYIAEQVIRAQEAEAKRQKTKEFIESVTQDMIEQAFREYRKEHGQ